MDKVDDGQIPAHLEEDAESGDIHLFQQKVERGKEEKVDGQQPDRFHRTCVVIFMAPGEKAQAEPPRESDIDHRDPAGYHEKSSIEPSPLTPNRPF